MQAERERSGLIPLAPKSRIAIPEKSEKQTVLLRQKPRPETSAAKQAELNHKSSIWQQQERLGINKARTWKKTPKRLKIKKNRGLNDKNKLFFN